MKKTMIALVVAIVLVGVTKTTVAAGYPPVDNPYPGTPTVVAPPSNLWMIVSKMALESYAKERVAQAASYGGSASTILPGGRTWAQVFASNPDIRVIQQLLGKEILAFEVADPEVDQYFCAQYLDNAGYGLFWGWNTFRLQKDSAGKWQVPPNAKNVDPEMVAYQVPIYIPGVNYAYTLATDENGNQRYVQLRVENDRVLYYQSLAGFVGQVIISVGNGGAIYDMSSGEQVSTTLIESGVNASIKGLITLDDPNQIVSNPKSVNGQGENPMYQVAFSSAAKIELKAKTTEGELATGVIVRKVGDENPTYWPIEPGQSVVVPFEQGIYDVWFEYPTFDVDNPSIPPWWYQEG